MDCRLLIFMLMFLHVLFGTGGDVHATIFKLKKILTVRGGMLRFS